MYRTQAVRDSPRAISSENPPPLNTHASRNPWTHKKEQIIASLQQLMLDYVIDFGAGANCSNSRDFSRRAQ